MSEESKDVTIAKSKDISENIAESITNYADYIDYEQVFRKAVSLFSKQAMLHENDEETLASIELTDSKANSFLKSIHNLMSISHEIDIMSAEKDRFRRKDELRILNNLREQCELQSQAGLNTMQMISKRLNELQNAISGDPIDLEEIANLQALLDNAVVNTQRVVASTSRLIQLERTSGSRPLGKQDSRSTSIAHIKALEEHAQKSDPAIEGKGPARKLSLEDLSGLGADD